MSHKTYTTDAIVCGARDSNTADRSFLLFTEVAGMLYANARSVREERSKQRYALQNFSRIRVSLVKGKTGWRIGSVQADGNYFQEATDRTARGGVTSVVRLVRRFVTDEDPQPVVFADMRHVLEAFVISPEKTVMLTEHFTLRLLATLGYIAPHASYKALLEDVAWSATVAPLPPQAAKAIEQGLHVSHL